MAAAPEDTPLLVAGCLLLSWDSLAVHCLDSGGQNLQMAEKRDADGMHGS